MKEIVSTDPLRFPRSSYSYFQNLSYLQSPVGTLSAFSRAPVLPGAGTSTLEIIRPKKEKLSVLAVYLFRIASTLSTRFKVYQRASCILFCWLCWLSCWGRPEKSKTIGFVQLLWKARRTDVITMLCRIGYNVEQSLVTRRPGSVMLVTKNVDEE